LEEVKTVEVERWPRAADLEECRLCFHMPVALVSCFVFVVMDLFGIDLGVLIKQCKVPGVEAKEDDLILVSNRSCPSAY
jgi:hypothetical protein